MCLSTSEGQERDVCENKLWPPTPAPPPHSHLALATAWAHAWGMHSAHALRPFTWGAHLAHIGQIPPRPRQGRNSGKQACQLFDYLFGPNLRALSVSENRQNMDARGSNRFEMGILGRTPARIHAADMACRDESRYSTLKHPRPWKSHVAGTKFVEQARVPDFVGSHDPPSPKSRDCGMFDEFVVSPDDMFAL